MNQGVWVPAFAGTTIEVVRRRAPRQVSDSNFKQPLSFAHASSFPRVARGELLVVPLINEGRGAPKGAMVLFRFLGEGSASPLGAPQTSSRSLRKLDCYFAAILGEGSALP